MMQRSLILLALLAPFIAAQGVIRVPSQAANIQQAIDASLPGGVVLIAPGTYAGGLRIVGKRVDLVAESGPGTVTINGSLAVRSACEEGRCLLVADVPAPGRIALRDLDFRNGSGGAYCVGSESGVSGGGGILFLGACGEVRGCRFFSCRALHASARFEDGMGGAIAYHSSTTITPLPAASTLDIVNCHFEDCAAAPGANVMTSSTNAAWGGAGGAVALRGAFCSLNVQRSIFLRNRAGDGGTFAFPPQGGLGGFGGAILDNGAVPGRIENCVFAFNQAGQGSSAGIVSNGPGGSGGAVAGATTIVNCTFFANQAGLGGRNPCCGGGFDGLGDAIYGGIQNVPFVRADVFNSIFWGHPGIEMAARVSVADCLVENSAPGTSVIRTDPRFVDPASEDFSLSIDSPAINVGDASFWNAQSVDLAGNPRIQCGGVDLGALERDLLPRSGVWWVGQGITSGGCGASLAPLTTIQEAIGRAASGDVINVLPGTYTEHLDFQGKTLTVRGTGGALSTSIVSPPTNLGVVRMSSAPGGTSVLSGFRITGGFTFAGGGIQVQGGSVVIANCIVEQCSAAADGGGISLVDTDARLINVRISGNTSGFRSGGLHVGGASNVLLTHCLIADNTAPTGSEIQVRDSASASFQNGILWHPASGNPVDVQPGASLTFSFSTVPAALPGSTNDSRDPLLGASYELTASSPAIDAGSILLPELPVIDLAGIFRSDRRPDRGPLEVRRTCGPPPRTVCEPGGQGNGPMFYTWPGTEDDLGMWTRINGGGDPLDDEKTAITGEVVSTLVHSPNGALVGTSCWLFLQAFPTGSAPMPVNGTLHLDPLQAINLIGARTGFSLLPTGRTFTASVPPGLTGVTVRFQAISLTSRATNGVYASTPAHEVAIL